MLHRVVLWIAFALPVHYSNSINLTRKIKIKLIKKAPVVALQTSQQPASECQRFHMDPCIKKIIMLFELGE